MQKRTSRLIATGAAIALLAGTNSATMALPLASGQPAAGSVHGIVTPVNSRHHRHHGHWGHGGWNDWGWWGGPALGLGLLGLGLATAAANNNNYGDDCIRRNGALYCRR